jgi:hypothetical protein
MKSTITTCVFFLLAIGLHSQITVKDQPKKIAEPVKIKNISTTAPGGFQPTQGKDLKITIDRIDDISVIDQNNYRVNYTVYNAGTEPVDVSKYNSGGISGAFLSNGKVISSFDGGTANLYTNGRTVLQPGESIKGAIEVLRQNLVTGATYKYTLTVDSESRIEEANENNNTAESTITARAVKNSEYFLTSAKITVQTGNDNKEANNSLVYYYIGVANYNEKLAFALGGGPNKSAYTPEIPANSTTELLPNRSLDPGQYGIQSPYNTLCFYKQRGLAVSVFYDNKTWATDAWKINSISVTVEFKDRNGNPYPYPAYASRTITFPVNGLLGYRNGDDITTNKNQLRVLLMGTDENFNPLPVEFSKYPVTMFLQVNNSPLKNAPIVYCY